MSTGPGTCHLDLLSIMAAVHPRFHTSFLKPTGPQPARPPALEDDYYKVETIFQFKKHGTHPKVKYIRYNSSCKQWIKLFEL